MPAAVTEHTAPPQWVWSSLSVPFSPCRRVLEKQCSGWLGLSLWSLRGLSLSCCRVESLHKMQVRAPALLCPTQQPALSAHPTEPASRKAFLVSIYSGACDTSTGFSLLAFCFLSRPFRQRLAFLRPSGRSVSPHGHQREAWSRRDAARSGQGSDTSGCVSARGVTSRLSSCPGQLHQPRRTLIRLHTSDKRGTHSLLSSPMQ